jgi:trehalose synthase
MLPKVAIGRPNPSLQTNIETYRILVGDEMIDELLALARELRKVRICHINSTAHGGGVAELLSRYLPLLQGLGISAEWRLIHGDPSFFKVTKAFHNALQGGHYDLNEPEQDTYLKINQQSAGLLDTNYDIVVVHDPQPAAVRHFAGARGAKWIWWRESAAWK